MNEVFDTLTGVFEELRSESREREYSVQTEKAVNANAILKREQKIFEKWITTLSDEDRVHVEKYLNAVEHAHFQEEQRAYYQGIVDTMQILIGFGIVKKRDEIENLLNKITE